MKLKKILIIITLLCVLLPQVSYAGFLDIEKDNICYEEITVLSALNIISGYEDGDFKPDNKVTRAEFCALISRTLGMGDAGNNKVRTNFTDVPYEHWASGYVNTALGAGLINGVGDDRFEPEEEVTYEQAVKIIVSALGYVPLAEEIGGYPNGYMLVGNQAGVTNGTAKIKGGLARQMVAKLLFNSLTSVCGEYCCYTPSTHSTNLPNPRVSILYTKLAIIKADARIISLDKSMANLKYNSINKCAVLNGWTIKKDDDKSNALLPDKLSIANVDVSDAIGVPANIYIDISDDENLKIVVAVPKKGIPTIEIAPSLLINKNNNGYIEYYKTETDDILTKTKIAEKMTVYNNLSLSSYDDIKEKSKSELIYKYIDTDNDQIFDTVFIKQKKSDE